MYIFNFPDTFIELNKYIFFAERSIWMLFNIKRFYYSGLQGY